MKKIVLGLVGALMLAANADAFNARLLANNKEVHSRVLTQQDRKNTDQWINQHYLRGEDLRNQAFMALANSFNELEKEKSSCEMGLISFLQAEAKQQQLIRGNDEIKTFINYLRHSDLIDDLLYKILKDSVTIEIEFARAPNLNPLRPRNLYTRQNSQVDVDKMYAEFKTWPNEKSQCSFDAYYRLSQKISSKTTTDRDIQLQKLNYIAFTKNIISQENYNKLEILRKKAVLGWPIYLDRYVDIITNVKDKLAKNPEPKPANDFGSEYVSRKQSITQRGNLYRTYNSTQVMMLAQIIEKTAKRLDSKRVSINWQYTDDPEGETQVYIFSPMEQYRAAIKMLRKDLGEVMRSETFKGTGLEYSHLIAAAFEAGYIQSEELDYVLKFEDFWNPKIPKWKTYANFAFSLAGTATFYLPPPWNILGSIGLVLAQGKYDENQTEADPDDNWNVII